MYIFRDAQGYQDWFEAISVIEFAGTLSSSGESAGHYTCDIRESFLKTWFKTNDNSNPIPLSVSDVSKNAYVVLFKRVG